MKSLNSKWTTAGTPSAMAIKLSSPNQTRRHKTGTHKTHTDKENVRDWLESMMILWNRLQMNPSYRWRSWLQEVVHRVLMGVEDIQRRRALKGGERERKREKILQGNKWWWPANNLTIENNFGGSVMVGNLVPRQGSMGKSSSTYPSSVCGHATVFPTSKIAPIGNEKHRTIATALAVGKWPKKEGNE
jgi:hypothetical protein